MNIKVEDLRLEQFKMQASQGRGDLAAGTRFSALGKGVYPIETAQQGQL